MSVWQDLVSVYRGYSGKPDQLKIASLAQWMLESGRGTSELARNYLNFGGIKYRDRMEGYATPVTYTGSDRVTTTYCKFGSISEFIDGCWHFITSPAAPYKDWQKYENDAGGYLTYIAQAGYCPLTSYADQVSKGFSEAATLLGLSIQQAPAVGTPPVKPVIPSPSASALPSRPAWHEELRATFLNRRSSPIQGIVLHDTAGSGTHNDTRYLSNPQDGRKVSVDFTVEKDGSIWKLNPDLRSYYCNHAGRATEWLGFKNAQVNAVTIGIEIVQTVSAIPALPEWL
jgi:hypothetical protein